VDELIINNYIKNGYTRDYISIYRLTEGQATKVRSDRPGALRRVRHQLGHPHYSLGCCLPRVHELPCPQIKCGESRPQDIISDEGTHNKRSNDLKSKSLTGPFFIF
jgi:hypothetical protein